MSNKVENKTPEQIKAEDVARKRENYEWIQCIISGLIICVLIFVFAVRIIDVKGNSMFPTLSNGDRLLVSDLFYTPKQGDIVIFKTDSYDPNKALVKRVIAVEGDVINIDFEKGIVYVNDEPITEEYINDLTKNKLDFIGPQTVPENCVFVMGDNRNASTDSRDDRIGMVDARLILGKVYLRVYPFSEIGKVN